MQEKLGAILEKLDEICTRLQAIEERVEEIENDAAAERNDILCEVQGVTQFIEMLYEHEKLDFSALDWRNVIFVHTNALNTAAFIEMLVDRWGSLAQTHKMTKDDLTPTCLTDIIEKNRYVVITSEIFSWSPEFEKIVCDAITTEKAVFAILTSDLGNVPLSLETKCDIIA